ncbi:MAG: hypothetical protein AAF531_12260 [Actinomycetota bacterium]
MIYYVSLTRRDVVSVHTLSGRPARFSSKSAWPRLITHLESLHAAGPRARGGTATELLTRSGPNGLTVLISDLLDDQWEPALNRLPARGADLAVVQVLGRGELDPEVLGDVDLVDVETGRRMPMSLTDGAIARYETRRDEWLARINNRVAALNASYTMIPADADLRTVLLGSLRAGGLVS